MRVAAALDPNGVNPKNRPAVVISDDCTGPTIVVVYITGEMDDPLPPEQVAMRWAAEGHQLTGLHKPCVAVCSWYERVSVSRLLDRMGTCPPYTTGAILLQLGKLLKRKQ